MIDLKQILENYDSLPEEQRAEIDKMLMADITQTPWRPMIDINEPEKDTPQKIAYDSPAEIMLYGGCVSGETEYLSPTG